MMGKIDNSMVGDPFVIILLNFTIRFFCVYKTKFNAKWQLNFYKVVLLELYRDRLAAF